MKNPAPVLISLIAAIAILPVYAAANEIKTIAKPAPATTGLMSGFSGAMPCEKHENANVSVSFNGNTDDAAIVKNKLDANIDGVKALAKEQHFDKFQLMSSNYNVSTINNGEDNGGTRFQYSGNANFTVSPASKALDFFTLLNKKGYRANINANTYRSGNCQPEDNADETGDK